MFKKLNELYERNFATFEIKKRTQLGTKPFLEKYISSLTTSNKILKICLPLLFVLNLVNVVLNSVIYANSGDTFYLVMLCVWACIFLLWGFVGVLFYTHRFKFNENKINHWKQELAELNKKGE